LHEEGESDEKQREKDEKLQADAMEKDTKKDNKNTMVAEGAIKAKAIAEHTAEEKKVKDTLAASQQRANNKQESMQEANNKAATADTQARHCEGELYRRRRTCACDDMGGGEERDLMEARGTSDATQSGWGRTSTKRERKVSAKRGSPDGRTETIRASPQRYARAEISTGRQLLGIFDNIPLLGSGRRRTPHPTPYPTRPPTPRPSPHPTPHPTPPPYSAAEFAIDKKKMHNWERRRYVRRRYVKPSVVDRRRRYAFPTPPPPARLPGAVCPCCPANQKPKSQACVIADEKAEETKKHFSKDASTGHQITANKLANARL